MNGAVEICEAEGSRAGDLAVFDLEVFERAKQIIADGTAENTKKAYKSDLGYYIAWARASGLSCELPIPSPDYLLRFIVDHLEGLDEAVDLLALIED